MVRRRLAALPKTRPEWLTGRRSVYHWLSFWASFWSYVQSRLGEGQTSIPKSSKGKVTNVGNVAGSIVDYNVEFDDSDYGTRLVSKDDLTSS